MGDHLLRDWGAFLNDHGVDAGLSQIWTSFERPQIELLLRDPHEPGRTPAGTTRFGGHPDLPPDAVWPVRPRYDYADDYVMPQARAEAPLAFLCQINLEDVARAGGCGLSLPERGLVSFFYDSGCQPWGFDPGDAVGSAALYTPAATPLASHAPPPHLEGPSAPGFAAEMLYRTCLPDQESLFAEIKASHPEWMPRLPELLADVPDEVWSALTAEGHAIGGWPMTLQGEMRMECQLASHGIYCGTSDSYNTPEAKALRRGALDWRVLLQLDSDEERLGWMWGDGGRLYRWARAVHGAAINPEHGWTVLQCY